MTLVHNIPIKRRVSNTDMMDEKSFDTHYNFSHYPKSLVEKIVSLSMDKSDMIQESNWNEDKKYKKKGQKSNFGSSPVHDYNLWFRYLKLLLEMEKQGLSFSKANTDLVFPSNDRRQIHKSVIGKDIIINKVGYNGWDLDKILEVNFSKWWKSHRFLFGKSYTVEMKESSEWNEGIELNGNVNLTHIRIDTRNSDKEILQDVKRIIKERRAKPMNQHIIEAKPQSKNYTYEMLSLSYNVMVRHLNGEPHFDIFLAEKNRIKELCDYKDVGYINQKLKIKVRGQKLNGVTFWKTYNRWRSRDLTDSPRIQKTHEYRGKTLELNPLSKKVIDENNLKTGVDQLIKGIILEMQEILLGVSEGVFVKKIKLLFDPKTGKRISRPPLRRTVTDRPLSYYDKFR